MKYQNLIAALVLLAVAAAPEEPCRRIPGSRIELPLSDDFRPIVGVRGLAHPDAAVTVRAWHVGPSPREQRDGNAAFREEAGFQERYAPQRGSEASTDWTRTADDREALVVHISDPHGEAEGSRQVMVWIDDRAGGEHTIDARFLSDDAEANAVAAEAFIASVDQLRIGKRPALSAGGLGEQPFTFTPPEWTRPYEPDEYFSSSGMVRSRGSGTDHRRAGHLIITGPLIVRGPLDPQAGQRFSGSVEEIFVGEVRRVVSNDLEWVEVEGTTMFQGWPAFGYIAYAEIDDPVVPDRRLRFFIESAGPITGRETWLPALRAVRESFRVHRPGDPPPADVIAAVAAQASEEQGEAEDEKAK